MLTTYILHEKRVLTYPVIISFSTNLYFNQKGTINLVTLLLKLEVKGKFKAVCAFTTIKATVMQIELINDRLYISKVS